MASNADRGAGELTDDEIMPVGRRGEDARERTARRAEEREVEAVAGGAPMPWWGWAIVLVFVGLGVMFVWTLVTERDSDRARAAAEGWTVVGSPPTSSGGATVWSKCDGSTRLYLTMGADGFAVGPAVPIPGGCR